MMDPEVKSAKLALKDQLDCPHWLAGIGVSEDANGYYIAIRVQDEADLAEARSALPETFEGFPVRVEAIGTVRAQP